MELKIGITSGGVKIPWKKLNLGISALNGVTLQVQQGFVVHQFAMKSTISFGFEGTLGAVLAITEWFKVADPDKGVLIKEFDGKLCEINVTPHCPKPIVDVELKIYDENNQNSYYDIGKVVNVPLTNANLMQTNFFLREPLKLHSVKGWHGNEDSLLAMR